MRELIKWLYTVFGFAYFNAILQQRGDGSGVNINVVFNKNFINMIDRLYREAGSTEYKATMSDNEKVNLYLIDTVLGLTEEDSSPYQEEEFSPDDPYRDVPVMSMRGGPPVKQVVDIQTAKRYGQGAEYAQG